MNSENKLPLMGFGTWNRTELETYQSVQDALLIGYRHIDTAQGYDNEQAVGKAIAESKVDRKEIFLTTKVKPENFGPNVILGTVKESLEKLQTEQVDLLLLHYPSIGGEYDMEDYIAQFAQVYDMGLCKNIGLSNFTISLLDQAISLLGDRKIITNQVEIHPLMQNTPIVEHCKSLGIPLTAYSPLARGEIMGHPVLTEIAKNHNATVAQISLAFLMSQNYSVIPAARSFDRIKENFDAIKIKLSFSEIETIKTIDEKKRLVDGPWCPQWDNY
ncbi:aldo/keto reductase [Marinicellulosiphila megalodicopiae]|uniref:aldo/keto reductase n=1 Tax=Marinicellulosiphila megalodicopiae TaxID=2724896 RepID=UPI003BAE945E